METKTSKQTAYWVLSRIYLTWTDRKWSLGTQIVYSWKVLLKVSRIGPSVLYRFILCEDVNRFRYFGEKIW